MNSVVQTLMAVSGQESLGLVVQASETFRSGDLQVAQKQLKCLSGIAERLIEESIEKERILKVRDDEQKEEEKTLHRKIGDAEVALNQQRDRVRNMEAEKARMNAVLADHKQDLERAESKKHDALKARQRSTTGTVAGGVAAGLLGVFFPPSLAVTLPAVAAIGGTHIACDQARMDQQRKVISETQNLISNKNREIERQNSQIRDIERDMSALESQKRSLEQERGQMRQTIVFLQKAITFFEELKAATEGGKQRTDLLHRITEKLTARETYSITTSNGCHKMCHSFVEAWGHVEEKMKSGEQYLAITQE